MCERDPGGVSETWEVVAFELGCPVELNMAHLRPFFAFFSQLALLTLLAQLPLARVSAQDAPRELSTAEYGKWESLGSTALSPDGRWVGFLVNDTGDIEVVSFREIR